MNSKTNIDIHFKGNSFSPKKLSELTRLPIESLVESGEISKIGRYRGKPSPYGIGLLKLNPEENVIDKYCTILLGYKSALKESKVEEILFDIETNDGFQYFSILPKTAKILSTLNARIEFHKIPQNEEDRLPLNKI